MFVISLNSYLKFRDAHLFIHTHTQTLISCLCVVFIAFCSSDNKDLFYFIPVLVCLNPSMPGWTLSLIDQGFLTTFSQDLNTGTLDTSLVWLLLKLCGVILWFPSSCWSGWGYSSLNKPGSSRSVQAVFLRTAGSSTDWAAASQQTDMLTQTYQTLIHPR